MTEKKVLSAYDQFESDASLENDGAWVEVGTMSFKLARAGGDNDDFVKTASKRFKPFQAAIAADSMPKQMAHELVVGVFVDTLIKDWKNVYGRDGELIAFSKEAASKLMMDLPNLFLQLQSEAAKIANFKRENLEAASGN